MLSNRLPALEVVKKRYGIRFKKYAILMYHPVTTEYEMLMNNIREVVYAVIESNNNYIVIYPNNDKGFEVILNEYKRFSRLENFKLFPSLKFEYFLSLLKNSEYIIGNSSAGIREAGVYGIPDIDIGTRQNRRYTLNNSKNIQHVCENKSDILNAIKDVKKYKITGSEFGDGNSAKHFIDLLQGEEIWNIELQKKFVDFNM